MKDVCFIIITHNRRDLLEKLLSSLVREFPFLSHDQVVIVVNGDGLLPYKSLKERFRFKYLNGNFKTPGVARNFALNNTNEEWVVFLDDDTELPHGYAKKFDEVFFGYKDQYQVIGGPDQTNQSANFFEKALGQALSSPMATAHTNKRHSQHIANKITGEEGNLILCHLIVNRLFLKKMNLEFNPSLFRNEENLLINQIIKSGGKCLYRRDFFVYHKRKTRIDQLARSSFSSGKNRVRSAIYGPNLLRPIFMIPALFVLYLVLLATPFKDAFSNLAYLPLVSYLILTVLFTVIYGKRNFRSSLGISLLAGFYQLLLNIFYGLGILTGLILLPIWFILGHINTRNLSSSHVQGS